MRVYLICSNDIYSLPCVVCDTLKIASEWLNVPLETLRTAIKRHGLYRGKKYVLEVVQIDNS